MADFHTPSDRILRKEDANKRLVEPSKLPPRFETVPVLDFIDYRDSSLLIKHDPIRLAPSKSMLILELDPWSLEIAQVRS